MTTPTPDRPEDLAGDDLSQFQDSIILTRAQYQAMRGLIEDAERDRLRLDYLAQIGQPSQNCDGMDPIPCATIDGVDLESHPHLRTAIDAAMQAQAETAVAQARQKIEG